MGQEDRELVAADPEGPVGPPDLLTQEATHLCQQLVSDPVALGIVDLLELVEVEEDQRHLVAVTPCLVEERLELLLERAMVPQPGEAIHERELANLHVRLLELIAGRLELGGRPQDLVGHPARQDDEQGADGNQGGEVDRLEAGRTAGQDPQQRRPERDRQDGGGGERKVEAQPNQAKGLARRRRGTRGWPDSDRIEGHGDRALALFHRAIDAALCIRLRRPLRTPPIVTPAHGTIRR